MIQLPRPRSACVLGLALTVLGGSQAGCYDARQVHAFLKNPPRCVSGVDYRVLPPDVLLITSTHIPEINKVRQRIRPDGKINLPLLGEIKVAGKTAKEIEAEINETAREYYGEVDANVQIVAYDSQKYYVFGQVQRPGPVAWTGHDTLLEALAQAQPNFLSGPAQITLVRGSGPQEGGQGDRNPSLKYALEGVHPDRKDNPAKKMTFNLWAMVKSGDMSNNVLLLPNDIIYVGANPLAEVGLAIQTLLLPIRPAAETVRYPANTLQNLGG